MIAKRKKNNFTGYICSYCGYERILHDSELSDPANDRWVKEHENMCTQNPLVHACDTCKFSKVLLKSIRICSICHEIMKYDKAAPCWVPR